MIPLFSSITRKKAAQGGGTNGTRLYVSTLHPTKVIYQYNLSAAWDISSASYASIVSPTLTTAANALRILPDGSAFIMAGTDANIRKYTLSPAWDISSAVIASTAAFGELCLDYSDDGTNCITTNDDGGGNVTAVGRLGMAPWAISGGTNPSGDISSQFAGVTSVTGIAYSTSGDKMFILGVDGFVRQYALSTAFNPSTRSYTSSTAFTGQGSGWRCFRIKPDGTKMWVLANKTIYQYTLTTPWTISTRVYDNVSFDLSTQFSSTTPRALFIGG